jgi:hypothetical protein
MLGPREITPAPSFELLVTRPASTTARAAARKPPALDDEYETGPSEEREATDGPHTLAGAVLKAGLLHFPPIEAEDLRQNPYALSHRVVVLSAQV